MEVNSEEDDEVQRPLNRDELEQTTLHTAVEYLFAPDYFR